MTLQLVTFRRSKTEVALKSSVKHESRLLLTVILFIFPSVTKWHYFEMTVEICQTRLSEHSKSLFFVLRGTLFVICISPVIPPPPPPRPKFCVQPSQEKLKTMLMQNFGWQTICILRDMQVSNTNLVWWVPCLFNLFFPVSSEKTRGFSNWNRWVLPVRTNERLLETTLPLKPFFPCSILRYSIRKTKGDSGYRKDGGYPWVVKTSLILINFISVKKNPLI